MSEQNDSNATYSPQETGPIRVLAAVIVRDGRYLVCKRPMHKRHGERHGGLWEFPGGKLEDGESWEHAARRELAEELALEAIRVDEPMFSVWDDGSPFEITFVRVEAEGDGQALEHEEIRWVTKEQMEQLELAPCDRLFAEWLADSETEHL